MVDHVLPHRLPTHQASSATPTIRRIGIADLRAVLRLGWEDFRAAPSQLFFLCIIYPVVALVFWKFARGHAIIPLFYPLASGFSLVGPIAAIGLYEISKRRERGQPATWRNCFDVFQSPALNSILALALVLLVIFVLWVAVADALFRSVFDTAGFSLMSGFLGVLFTSPGGWLLIIVGNLIGLVFATVVLCISVVSFPMMIDRNVDVMLAVRTSLQAVTQNRLVLAVWGVAVAILIALGMLMAFVGLAIVLPVLGHATWHLYRRLVAS